MRRKTEDFSSIFPETGDVHCVPTHSPKLQNQAKKKRYLKLIFKTE